MSLVVFVFLFGPLLFCVLFVLAMHGKFIGSTTTIKDRNQLFGVATFHNTQMSLHPFDGIMGLAYPSATRISNKTLLDQYYEQGQIKRRMFCIKLRYKEESLPSEFMLGGCDTKAEHWLPVIRKFLWTVTLHKIVLDSTTDNYSLEMKPHAAAAFDTGGVMSKICGKKTKASSHSL